MTEKLIKKKSTKEISLLRKSGRNLAAIAQELKGSLKSGTSTKNVDKKAEELIKKHGAKPAFKG